METENHYQDSEKEIDLADYLRVIIKRKRLGFTIFLLTVLAAAVFSFISLKVYKIDTLLEIGKIGGELLENPEQLVEKIKGDMYGVLIREKLKISEEKFPKIKSENPKGTNLVKIEIDSAETDLALKILADLNNLILEDHQEKIKAKIDLINQDIKTIEEKIKLAESDIEKTKNKLRGIDEDIKRIENKIEAAREEKKNLEAKVEALEKVLIYQQDPGTQFALFDTKEKLASKKQEIENLYLTINSLKTNKEDLEIQINLLKANIGDLNSQINSLEASLENIRPTEVIKSPTVSEDPIKPKPVVNMAIAAALGLLVGIFSVFCLEWWDKNKLKIRE